MEVERCRVNGLDDLLADSDSQILRDFVRSGTSNRPESSRATIEQQSRTGDEEW